VFKLSFAQPQASSAFEFFDSPQLAKRATAAKKVSTVFFNVFDFIIEVELSS
jgi:hypothetical protein